MCLCGAKVHWPDRSLIRPALLIYELRCREARVTYVLADGYFAEVCVVLIDGYFAEVCVLC